MILLIHIFEKFTMKLNEQQMYNVKTDEESGNLWSLGMDK